MCAPTMVSEMNVHPAPRTMHAVIDDDGDRYTPPVISLASLDDRRVAALDTEGRVILWDVELANRVKTVTVNTHAARITNSTAPNELLVGTDADALMRYDVESGRQISFFENRFQPTARFGDDGDESSSQLLVVRRDEPTQRVATGNTRKLVTLWCDRTETAVARWRADTAGSVRAVALHDHHVASGGADGIVRIWDVRRLPESANDARTRGAVAALDLSSNGPIGDLDFSGNLLLVGAAHNYVNTFNVRDECVAALDGTASPLAAAGKRLLTEWPVGAAPTRRLVTHARFRHHNPAQIRCAINERWAVIGLHDNSLHMQRAPHSRYAPTILTMCETTRGTVVTGDGEGVVAVWASAAA